MKLYNKVKKSFNFQELKLFLYYDFLYRLSCKIHYSSNSQILKHKLDEHYEWCLNEILLEFKITNIKFSINLINELKLFLTEKFYINSVKSQFYVEKEWYGVFYMNTNKIQDLNTLKNIYDIFERNHQKLLIY